MAQLFSILKRMYGYNATTLYGFGGEKRLKTQINPLRMEHPESDNVLFACVNGVRDHMSGETDGRAAAAGRKRHWLERETTHHDPGGLRHLLDSLSDGIQNPTDSRH